MPGFGSGGLEETPQPPPARAESASMPAIDASIWENVLRQTAGEEGCDTPLTPEELAALREVARRYRDQPLTLEPAAVALVQAVLLPQLPEDPDAALFWQQAFVQIAQTQWDDPAANDRLQRLWSQLQGERP
jgi:hypothetical protein